MIQFPITDLLSEQECYSYLLHILHPDGLECPSGHVLPPGQAAQDRSRDPLLDYKCRVCCKVFNVFTGTIWSGTHYDCRIIVLVMRGFAQGIPTLHLSNELGLDYGTLLSRRHKIQHLALVHRNDTPLADEVTEADEMFQNAGEKGDHHADLTDPPRHRANKRRGKGTKANDRPPILGDSGS